MVLTLFLKFFSVCLGVFCIWLVYKLEKISKTFYRVSVCALCIIMLYIDSSLFPEPLRQYAIAFVLSLVVTLTITYIVIIVKKVKKIIAGKWKNDGGDVSAMYDEENQLKHSEVLQRSCEEPDSTNVKDELENGC